MSVQAIGYVKKFIGVSGDVKPDDAVAGSRFFESDTGADYIYTGASWVEYSTISAAEIAKLNHISVTQAVDLDTIETNSNASKVKTDLISVTSAINLDNIPQSLVYSMTAAGSANTYTGTYTGLTYLTRLKMFVKINATNTGASTFNLNSLGAKTIYKVDALGTKTALAAGDLPIGYIAQLEYDGTDMILLNVTPPTYSTATDNTAPVFSLSSGVRNAIFNQALISGRTYTNLLADAVAGCEATTGWSVSNVTVATDNTVKFEGTNCLKFTLAAGKLAGTLYRDILASLDITKYYKITAHLRNGNATAVNLQVDCIGDKGNIASSTVTATSWYRRGIAIQPSDFDGASLVLITIGVAGTETQYAYVDAILVTEITAAEYATCTSGVAPQALMDKYPFILGTKGTAPQEIRSVGKNLLDKNSVIAGYVTASTGVITDGAGTRWRTPYTIIEANTTYVRPTLVSGLSDGNRQVAFYDANRNYISGVTLSGSDANATFTTPTNAMYFITSWEASGGFNLTLANIEKGSVSTAFEVYKSSVSYTPELHDVPSVQDTYDAVSGVHTVNTAYDADVSGAQWNSYDKTTYTNVDVVKSTAFTLAKAGTAAIDGYTRLYISSGLEASEIAAANIDEVASVGKCYYHTDKTVWYIVAADTYADIAAARTGLGTCAVRYALATPTYETIVQPPLQSFENGSISAIHKVRDTCLYDAAGDGFTITDSTYPISSLARVYKQSGDTITDIAISTCTVAAGGLTFTSTALSTGDTVVAIFYGVFSNSTVPTITHREAVNVLGMAEATSRGLNLLSNMTDAFVVYQNAVNLEFDARLTAGGH